MLGNPHGLMPEMRMGYRYFGASHSMRIVASWFGSNGSTEYKDVADGFYSHRQPEAGSASCRYVVLKSGHRPSP